MIKFYDLCKKKMEDVLKKLTIKFYDLCKNGWQNKEQTIKFYDD